MPEMIMGPREEAFLLSEAKGYRSRDAVTLKKSDDIYRPGTVVVAVADKYELATATNLDDGADGYAGDVAIVSRYADASLADEVAAAITSDAEVKGSDLIFDASLTLDDIEPLLAVKGIKARKTA